MARKNRRPSAVRLTICTRRSFGAGRRSIRPCSTSRSTRPVTLPFDTIMRCESSPSVMPFGARSSCASRSKRGSVMSKLSRRRRRTSVSISVVQVSSRSHSRNSSLWSCGRSATLVSASSGTARSVHHDFSACDRQRRAGDGRGVRRAQIEHGGRDLLRPDQPAERRVLDVGGERVGARAAGLGGDPGDAVAHEVGVGVARADRIDGDAGRAVSSGERAHQADHRVLGRAVGGDIGVALQAGGRGDVDDAAEAALDHAGEHRLDRDAPCPCTFTFEHAPEDRSVGLGERRGLGRAGIGDEDVDGAARGRGRRHLPPDLGRVGDVGDGVARGRAGGDRRAQRRFAAAEHGDGGAGSGQRRGDGAADAASAAGDQSVLACRAPYPCRSRIVQPMKIL